MKKLVNDDTKTVKKSRSKMYDQIERCRLDLQKDPSNPELHVRLGDLYVKWHLDIYNACKYIDEAIILYKETCKKDKYRILWDNLPVISQDEWIDQYIKSNYNNYLTYEAFEYSYFQVDIAKFVASNGEIIVSICACEYD